MHAPKVGFSSGAQWLLDGFGLLRRSPLGLGLLGAIFGLLVALLGMAGETALALLGQLVVMLAGPIVLGGMVWAAREVDAGREARPEHLLRGVHDGKVPRLLATLLPQWAVLLLAAVLLIALLGQTHLQTLQSIMIAAQAGQQPDPAVLATLPSGRILLWFLLVLGLGILAMFCTFVAIPAIMFGQTAAVPAMRASLQACLRNAGAVLLFVVLLLITAVGISLATSLVGSLVAAIGGQRLALVVVNVLMMAVLFPVYVGATLSAWKQFFGASADTQAVARQDHGFEA